MKKKIFIASLCLVNFLAVANAQETETKQEKKVIKKIIVTDDKKIETTGNDNTEDKKTKKVRVYVNGNKKNEDKKIKVITDEELKDGKETDDKKITVIVDGDKVTINGKPVDDMNNEDVEILRGNAADLKLIAPYLRKAGIARSFSNQNAQEIDIEEMINSGNLRNLNIDFGDDKKPNKALLGVITEKDERGAKINNVSKESAAEKAGLQKDDIITKVNDDKIENSDDLIKAIGKYNPDDEIKINYLRDGKSKNTKATLLKNNAKVVRAFSWNSNDEPFEITPPMPPAQNFNFNQFNRAHKPKLGFKIQDTEEGNGVKILEIENETPAAKAGLQKDDIITEINGSEIKSVDTIKDKLADAKDGDVLKIKFTRNGTTQNTEVKIPKKLKTANL